MFEITIYDARGEKIDFMIAYERDDAYYAANAFTPANGGYSILEVR